MDKLERQAIKFFEDEIFQYNIMLNGRLEPSYQKHIRNKVQYYKLAVNGINHKQIKGEYMNIKIKKLKDKAKLPTKGSDCAAGYDIYACTYVDTYIAPHTTKKIPTGLIMELPHGYFGAVFARSGLATKQGLRPANCVAVIDEDYRGEWFIPLHNDTDEIRVVKPFERIAQMILLPYQELNFEEAEELSETERGDGRFGSTGEK